MNSNKTSRQVTCSICNKTVPVSQCFDRWNAYFCSRECHDVRWAVEKKKIEEEEKRQAAKPVYRYSGCDVSGGNAF